MRLFIFVLLQVLALSSFADTVVVSRDANGAVKHLHFKGDFGDVTSSLFNFIEMYESTPANVRSDYKYRGKNYAALRWVSCGDCMEGYSYSFKAQIDGVENTATVVPSGTEVNVTIEGQLAEVLITGMWNMYRSSEENIKVTRTHRYGDVILEDNMSYITCKIETRERPDGLTAPFASCTITATLKN